MTDKGSFGARRLRNQQIDVPATLKISQQFRVVAQHHPIRQIAKALG